MERSHRTATVCHLGNIAYELKRPLVWDPVKEVFRAFEEMSWWWFEQLRRNRRDLVHFIGSDVLTRVGPDIPVGTNRLVVPTGTSRDKHTHFAVYVATARAGRQSFPASAPLPAHPSELAQRRDVDL